MSVGQALNIYSTGSSLIDHSCSRIHGLTGVIIKMTFCLIYLNIVTHTGASFRCHLNLRINMPGVNTWCD